MTKRYSRRDALLTGAALLTLPAASRAFTFGERDQWEDYAGLSSRASSYSGMSGTAGGFEYPGGSGRRNAYVFFDPQDPVSIRLCRHVRPYVGIVDVIFFPIAALGEESQRQAETIMLSHPQWRAMDEHLSLFNDEKRGGIGVKNDLFRNADINKLDFVHRYIKANTEPFTRANDPYTYPYAFFLPGDIGELRTFTVKETPAELDRLFGVARESFYGPDK